jgi:hypothetical protein
MDLSPPRTESRFEVLIGPSDDSRRLRAFRPKHSLTKPATAPTLPRVERKHDRDFGFFVWAVPGFLVVFGFYTGFSIGIPFLVLGLLLFAYLHARGPVWPADLGLLAGLGIGSLSFAGIALTSGEYSVSPWFEIGLGLTAGSAAAFWWLRCRPARA